MNGESKGARVASGDLKMRCILKRLTEPTGESSALWHTTLLAKCSVLYLLSWLPGKMRVSPDGNARFARQENGQVFADGDGQKPRRFQELQWVYWLLLE